MTGRRGRFALLPAVVLLSLGVAADPSGASAQQPAADPAAPAAQAAAQTAAQTSRAVDPSVASAINLLLEKAQFWYNKGRPDVALDFFTRVLSLQPENTDALIGASKVSFDLSHDAQAREFVERLRKIAPGDPFVLGFDSMRRMSSEDADTLKEARHLAVLGKKTEAVAAYQKLFHGKDCPEDLAAEYYPLYISSLPEDAEEADEALGKLDDLAKQNPNDLGLQLANGQAKIIGEGARNDGIQILKKLAHVPSVATRAKTLWRQALLWQGADFQSLDDLREYLSEYPSDPELDAKMADYKASLPSDALRFRLRGYEMMNQKNYKAAEDLFLQALSVDPNDVDAMIMLGAVYTTVGNPKWKDLMAKAIALAPDRKPEILLTLGADPVVNARLERESIARVQAQYDNVNTLVATKRYKQAEAALRALIAGKNNAGSLLMLADIQSMDGRPNDAIATLNKVLGFAPNSCEAQYGLASNYTKIGQNQQAAGLLDTALACFEAAHNDKGIKQIHDARAEQFELQAQSVNDPAQREALLRKAIAESPNLPWSRLSLARLLTEAGKPAEAQQMIDAIQKAASAPDASQTHDGREAIQAISQWYAEAGDVETGARWAEKVAPADRRPFMNDVIAQRDFARDLRATETMPTADGDARRLQMASTRDASGVRIQAIVDYYFHAQRNDIAQNAIELSLRNNQPLSSQLMIVYAGCYAQLNNIEAARALVGRIDRNNLTAIQKRNVAQLENNFAIHDALDMVAHGQYQKAEEKLRDLLARYPDNVGLQVGMARVQIAQGRSDLALPTLLAQLEKQPGDIGTRYAAIEAANNLQRYALVGTLTDDGMKLFPRNPYFPMQGANAARARGLNAEALSLMVRARTILNQQPDADSNDD